MPRNGNNNNNYTSMREGYFWKRVKQSTSNKRQEKTKKITQKLRRNSLKLKCFLGSLDAPKST